MRRALLASALLVPQRVASAGCRIEPTSRAPGTEPVADTSAGASAVDTIRVVRTDDVLHAGPPVLAPSGLAIPVAGVQVEDLVDTFDDARSDGRIHDAIDIPAPRGTPVVAAASGTLARVFESERGGLTVYVLDGRTVFYYAHLDTTAPGLAAGQAVARGQALGTVGSTGNASPDAPHLHFAVWHAPRAERFWDGEAFNPYPLLGGR